MFSWNHVRNDTNILEQRQCVVELATLLHTTTT